MTPEGPVAPGAGAETEGGLCRLLRPDEPAPVEIHNRSGPAPILLLCDHADRRLPRALGTLGLSRADLARHVAWDIGIAEVARAIAGRLDAPAVLTRYTRLVVDPNRALDDPTLIPQLSDGVVVPGNRNLSPAARRRRIDGFHRPYHEAVTGMLDRLADRAPAVISMHSFTPVLKGLDRPWQIGVLWNEDPRLPVPLMAKLRGLGVNVGENQPYSGRDGHGHTLHVHAEPRGLAHVLIEIRQDLIDTRHGAADWAGRLSGVLAEILADLAPGEAGPRP